MKMTKIRSILLVIVNLSLFYSVIIDVKIIKYILYGIVIGYLVSRKNEKYVIRWSLILIICIFTQWGIGQFIVQHSFGLQIIGESIINTSVSGVAKFGNGIIRGYGPFEHANVFGGINLLGLVLATWLCKSKNSLALKYLMMFIFGMGIFVSFSRAALLGSIILCLVAIASNEFRKTGIVLLKIIIILFIIFSPLLIIRANDSKDTALNERMRGYKWNIQMIKSHNIWLGLGTSNYKMELKKNLEMFGVEYKPWEIDYVHSVPLLVFAQSGILGSSAMLIIILLWMIKTMNIDVILITGSLMPTLLLDHFWITQTPALIFLLAAIWVLTSEKMDRKKYV